jgi:hypothetical protein
MSEPTYSEAGRHKRQQISTSFYEEPQLGSFF